MKVTFKTGLQAWMTDSETENKWDGLLQKQGYLLMSRCVWEEEQFVITDRFTLTAAAWLSLSKRNFRLDRGELLFFSSERETQKPSVKAGLDGCSLCCLCGRFTESNLWGCDTWWADTKSERLAPPTVKRTGQTDGLVHGMPSVEDSLFS